MNMIQDMSNDRSTRFRTTHDRDLSPVTLRSWERGMLRYALMMVVMMVVGVTDVLGQFLW